ncbi:MAG: tRNA(His) guanylyltransferase Thg1 family protein [Candidatus Woesearchaeota archaeon]
MKNDIGNRMKKYYEDRNRHHLTRRTPVIIRIDGKAFHQLTKKFDKPFDKWFTNTMSEVAYHLLKNIQGAKCVYSQSDEISILLKDFDRLNTDAWFDYNVQKISSVSASMASSIFTRTLIKDSEYDMKLKQISRNIISFDSRVFNIPKEEVCNYFIWRQKDWIKNSIQMLARAYFSHKQLHKKSLSDMHDMLYEIGVNWNDLNPVFKNGYFAVRLYDNSTVYEKNIIFTKNRDVFERILKPLEE